MRISFKHIKETISLKEVSDGYGVKLQAMGEELVGPCPLHGGDNPTAFHLNPRKNRWTCFTKCKFGDVIDFVSLIEPCSLREAAEILVKKYSLYGNEVPSVHPYLAKRELDRQTLDIFGVKYQKEGPWRGMITIPLHDEDGRFLGYLGRRLTHLKRGKYKIQKGVKRSQILFNLHRVDLSKRTFVVEGPFDTMRLHQAGYSNVVSLLGRTLSDFQYGILKQTPITLMLDQDDAGILATQKILKQLKDAKTIQLPAKDPGEMSMDAIRNTLGKQDIG